MEITEQQYQQVAHLFPVQRGNVKLSNLPVLNAVLYLAEQGCKWRGLPERFCGILLGERRVRRRRTRPRKFDEMESKVSSAAPAVLEHFENGIHPGIPRITDSTFPQQNATEPPERYGPWHTIYMRWQRWNQQGALARVFAGLQEIGVLPEHWEVLALDSASVKGHPDATGAPKKRGHKP